MQDVITRQRNGPKQQNGIWQVATDFSVQVTLPVLRNVSERQRSVTLNRENTGWLLP